MPYKRLRYSPLTLLALLLLLAACGTTVQPKYYLLTPIAGNTADRVQKQLSISVGPVNLPKYLDRSQIVTRHDDSELDLADGHRWAEPLQGNFSAVLADNLRQRLQQARVIVFPARDITGVDYRVSVDVMRFDVDDNDEAVLIAEWSIQDGNRTTVITSRRTSYRSGVNPASGYAAIVAALSDTVGRLSGDIVSSIPGIGDSH